MKKKNGDQYNLTFGVYTPVGQTKNDHSQGTVTQIGFILPLQKESNSKKGVAIPEALFLKSHSFQQQQPFEDQQPYLHFDKNAKECQDSEETSTLFSTSCNYHLVTLKINHHNI